MLIFDTICALATARYKSALAIVRLSGDKTFDILSKMIKRDVSKLEGNSSYFCKIYKDKDDPASLIDECVITVYRKPKSYTGFDSVDFSIHGSTLIADDLLDALVSLGARRAEKGEFSAQSYFNGKMDLLKAEGINDLINARSKRAKEIALNTLSGKNSSFMNDLKTDILNDIASLEYFVENRFVDEGEDDELEEQFQIIKESLFKNIKEVKKNLEETKRSNKRYEGFTLTIAGQPNVGKSTLLNALVKENKAIVSPIPGTTRDVVEGEIQIDGINIKIKDTAGIRKSDDLVENLGIERSYQSIKDADIVLLVSDTSFEEFEKNDDIKEVLRGKKTIKVQSKTDIKSKDKNADISVCALKDDLTPLIDLIRAKLDFDQKENGAFLGKREEDFLKDILEQLYQVYDILSSSYELDIVSDCLRKVVTTINDMLGNDSCKTMEDIYETLFSKFCLGK